MQRIRRRLACSAAVLASAALACGCATHQVPPLNAAAVQALRSFGQYVVYWAGPKVDGVALTQADSPVYFYQPVGFTMYYGNCGRRGKLHDGGCTLPLKITTTVYSPHSDASFGPQRWTTLHGVPAVVYHGGDDIEIYVVRKEIDIAAESSKLAMAAALALRPFNEGASTDLPAFPQPYYPPDPSQAELNALAAGPTAGTGATGATGATTAIAPAPGLQPTPEANGTF